MNTSTYPVGIVMILFYYIVCQYLIKAVQSILEKNMIKLNFRYDLEKYSNKKNIPMY